MHNALLLCIESLAFFNEHIFTDFYMLLISIFIEFSSTGRAFLQICLLSLHKGREFWLSRSCCCRTVCLIPKGLSLLWLWFLARSRRLLLLGVIVGGMIIISLIFILFILCFVVIWVECFSVIFILRIVLLRIVFYLSIYVFP